MIAAVLALALVGADPTVLTSSLARPLTSYERALYQLEQDAVFEARRCVASLRRCNGDLADLRASQHAIQGALIEQAKSLAAEAAQDSGWSPWLAVAIGAIALLGGAVIGFELRGR